MRKPTISRREPPVTPRGEGRSAWRATLEVALARPQRGVDAMAAEFTGTTPIPGVADAGS